MFFNKKIEIITYIDTPSITIRAVCKNKELGKMTCSFNKKTRSIMISDIICKKNNKGYGSLMMKKLIDLARWDGNKYIDGWLSAVDENHIERLYHFYQKFGFDIILNKKGIKIADIKLVL